MIKFTHIESFVTVKKYVERANACIIPGAKSIDRPVNFRGTVKLHGTNASVVCTPDGLQAQSRRSPISVGQDNAGFAAFVADKIRAVHIRQFEKHVRGKYEVADNVPLTLYGEFIGPGIQKGMAISQLAKKQWVLFAVAAGEGDDKRYIDALTPHCYAGHDIYCVLDVKTWELVVDFSSRESMQAAVDIAEAATLEVEAECPWGKRFDISGLGEGIVWTPIAEHWGDSALYWKSKGPKHKNVKTAKTQPQIDPEVLVSIDAFIEFSVTDNRLNQGIEILNEAGHDITMANTKHFLAWFGGDVKRECQAELEASGLEWKQVSRSVSNKAIAFYKAKVNEI